MKRSISCFTICIIPTALVTTLACCLVRADPPAVSGNVPKHTPYPSLLKTLTAPKAPEDPLKPIADQMKDVVGDLTAMETSVPVQTKQQNVTSALDSIIKQLERESKGNGGASPNPTKPMSRSTLAKGPGGSGPLHDAAEGTRVWGQLPPKDRQEILQSRTEGFPAGYDSVLANYYSRLAQEQVKDDAGNDQPTTRPSGH